MDIAENAVRALRIVREAKDIVYDTETSGLDWRQHSPIGYVIGTAEGNGVTSLYVPIRHGGGGNLLGGKAIQAINEPIVLHEFEHALAHAFKERQRLHPHGRIIGHNTKFDCHMSANAGILLGRRMACTQLNEALLDEYAKQYSLEASAERRGVTAKKGQELYDHMARLFGGPADRSSMQYFWRTAGNDPTVVDYTEGDGISTWELYWKQRELLTEQELDVVYELESDLIWTVFRMERTGIKVSTDRAAALREATEDEISRLLTRFPDGFNTRSPLQVKKVMEDAGHTDWPTTPVHGNPSFTEKWLKKSEPGRAIVQIRQNANLINTFIKPLTTHHVHKGRVHANLNQLKSDNSGTAARFSCSNPNLQAVPKRLKVLAKRFRSLFVADEGWEFWERDYSQCEPRLFAHYSQDANLLQGYNAEPFVDVHHLVSEFFNVERDPTAKRMNMGMFTGMQTRTFADHMGWDIETASEKWEGWFRLFPGIRQFQRKAKLVIVQRGYVKTLLGRRGRLEEPRFAYVATSKIIQGGNADILKYKLLQADRLSEDNGDIARVLMTVHDSFNGQYEKTPEGRALFEEMIRLMVDVQTPPFNLSVPFVMDGHEGADWAEATFGVQHA